jgi:hypothetical protein
VKPVLLPRPEGVQDASRIPDQGDDRRPVPYGDSTARQALDNGGRHVESLLDAVHGVE